jgi:hypothetical protein
MGTVARSAISRALRSTNRRIDRSVDAMRGPVSETIGRSLVPSLRR